MRPHFCVTLGSLCCVFLGVSPLALGQQKEYQEQKFFTGKELADARRVLKGDLRDTAIARAFSPNDKNVVAVLLKVTRTKDDIKEIKVYANYRNDKKLKLLKSLDDKNDPDFAKLVKELKLY
jgi:hypothetical protein